jgi:hypothetical protein
MAPRSRWRRFAAGVLVLAGVLLSAPEADAAAPRYILVTGPGISHPILLASWRENQDLMTALVQAPFASGRAARLADRPRFDLAEFWGWEPPPARPTRPADAGDHGAFYPAHGSRLAVVSMVLGGVARLRLVPASALRILARHRVPLRA